ncbi:efflux RND transporter periplasmic adaptor subunit [Desulforamulus aeronauticus]|uniref:RND family efflux transporter, MFP subunit n=1 Tax=Desulforamulus aeronauticus DSM 10349 TaxID=1121421 RepID=A0A1M6WJ27_9FIRM|nr:efflux RND transporter periplasmic adaptor subunit [Desulforamulus aeronauticus]SHK93691.1 RND family efflux transporter, MFP subunit [Desulforamulus aeronauticus DSM 10349]
MKSKWKLWLIPVIAVLAFGVLKGGNIWGKGETTKVAPMQTVAITQVEKVKVENTLTLTGSIEAVKESIISTKVSTGGRISSILVENGDQVTAGQALVTLEQQDFLHILAMRQADLKKAESGLITAKADLQRYQELYQQGAISPKEYEAVEAALQVAEATVSSATAGVAMAQEDLTNATMIAPIGGLVANRNVKTGQMVSAQSGSLMTVQDISSVYVVVNTPQKDLAIMKKGLKTEATVDAFGDKKFTGTVEVINPVANQGARVFETKIKVDNPELLLKPGMFAKVGVKTGEAVEVLAIPQGALTSKQGMYFVFVPEGNKVKRVQIEIGQVINQMVEIKKGLTEGQQIVVTNVNKLKDQDLVTAVK